MKRIIAPGFRRGRCYVISHKERNIWIVGCDCGNIVELTSIQVRKVKSCGCLRSESHKKAMGAYRERQRRRREMIELQCIPKPQMFSNKACPKCLGKMQADRYFACYSCKPKESESWMEEYTYHDPCRAKLEE